MIQRRKSSSSAAPSKRRQRRLPPGERREQLLKCALITAARTGLGRIGHAEVAREAGVAVPTVFLYFPNRTALVSAVIEDVKSFYLAQGQQWHERDQVAKKVLQGHLHAFAASVETDPEYAQVWLEWSTAVRNEDGIWDSFLDYQQRIVNMITATIRRGQREGTVLKTVAAMDAARLFVSSAYAITQLCFMRRERRVINRFVEHVVQLALHD